MARINPFMVLYEWFRATLPPLLLVALPVQSTSASEPLRPSNYVPVGIEISELSLNFELSHFELSHPPERFRPRRDLPAWDASLPIDWSADPFKDRN